MEKEILLAVNFAKAPKELQDAAKAYEQVLKKISKTEANISEKTKELEALSIEEGQLAKAFRAALKAWDVGAL